MDECEGQLGGRCMTLCLCLTTIQSDRTQMAFKDLLHFLQTRESSKNKPNK